ncbi:hypothetical protein [Nocardia aurantia]|uniref:hypothetical protein n=1 Tax=Nocardia aurantia TaxID=2585199 RepID=UPI001297EB77|nr:hypothetical protein [Nocardia aurantia]
MTDGHGGAGWGWVPDIPPNPQNTAEVVCALTNAGESIPRAAEVVTLVGQNAVVREEHGEWVFHAPIDLSWRLRALQCLGIPSSDPSAAACRTALITAQESDSGGWRMSGRIGPVSVSATSSAIQALCGDTASDEATARAVLRGTMFLAESMLEQDPRTQPMYACAYVAAALARPEISAVGGKKIDRGRDLAVQHLLAHLAAGYPRIEEEHFRRADVADTWRHLSLHLSVGALLSVEPRTVFEPVVRRALIDLLDLQEPEELQAQYGGFRTSTEGFVTSYATTQALDSMLAARQVMHEKISPARVFDLICRDEGRHHLDAQNVIEFGGYPVVMNSPAGIGALLAGVPAGLTIALLAIGFADELGKAGSRALVVWGMLFVAFGTLAGLATRFPAVSKLRIATSVFAGYTAVVLPIVSFLLT